MKKIICGLVVLMVLVSGFFYEKIVEKVDYFIKKETSQTTGSLFLKLCVNIKDFKSNL